MAYIDTAITETTEPMLIKKFIDTITTDTRVVCNKTSSAVVAEYADTSIKTSFTLTIDNTIVIYYERSQYNGDATFWFNCEVRDTNNNVLRALNDGMYLQWVGDNAHPDEVISRTLYYKLLSNTNLLWLEFGCYRNTYPNSLNAQFCVFDCTDGTKGYGFGGRDGTLSSESLINSPTFTGTSPNAGTISTIFNDNIYDAQHIDTIAALTYKNYKSADAIVKTTVAMIDTCKHLFPLYSTVCISGQYYYVYNNHTLIPFQY